MAAFAPPDSSRKTEHRTSNIETFLILPNVKVEIDIQLSVYFVLHV